MIESVFEIPLTDHRRRGRYWSTAQEALIALVSLTYGMIKGNLPR